MEHEKRCQVVLQGEIVCEGGKKECCCYQTLTETLDCDAEPDDLVSAIGALPLYAEVITLVNFGNDGWVLVYKVPVPCDTATQPGG